MRRFAVLALASGFGLGYSPVISGTVGTLYGIALYPAWDAVREVSVAGYLAFFVVFLGFSIWIADLAEKETGEKDSGKIVIDEAIGYFAATLFLPLTWTNLVLTFFAFRFFDIVKIWPASYFDRKHPGGVGVVMDDVFAGFYANLVVRAILWLAG